MAKFEVILNNGSDTFKIEGVEAAKDSFILSLHDSMKRDTFDANMIANKSDLLNLAEAIMRHFDANRVLK